MISDAPKIRRDFEVLFKTTDGQPLSGVVPGPTMDMFAELADHENLLLQQPETPEENIKEGLLCRFSVASWGDDDDAMRTDNIHEYLRAAVALEMPEKTVVVDEISETLRFIVF